MNVFITHLKAVRLYAVLAFLLSAWAAEAQTGYYIRFPNDVLITSCDQNYDVSNLPAPILLDPSGTALLDKSYYDVVYTEVPGYCFAIERFWSIIDWNTYNPNLPATTVPNPEPTPSENHLSNLAGPIVSPAGTAYPWTPSNVLINSSDPAPTNYSSFWSATANRYEYTQHIRFLSGAVCPKDTVLLTTAPICGAAYSYDTIAVMEENPGWTLAQTAGLPSGSLFPIGQTVNTFQVTEADGATKICSFSVKVKELTPPVAVCKDVVSVTIGADASNDCYDGGVKWLPATFFDDGSYDDCGNIHLTIQRFGSNFSDCILALNPVNGHPTCDPAQDPFPDFPSEFERAISEQDSIKFYCCESGSDQSLILRVYQTNADGNISTDLDGAPIFTECLVIVSVTNTDCADTSEAIRGQISLDTNDDCLPDAVQTGVPGMVVRAVDSNGDTLYAGGSQQGFYAFHDPIPGTTTLDVITPQALWEICENPVTLSVPNPPGIIIQNFTAQPLVDCPALYVNLATTRIRPCSTSTWFVTYCNVGGAAATDASVQLIASPELTLTGASQPYTVNGDTIMVQIGNLNVGECGNFTVQLHTDCDPELAGARLCVEAHIFPDTSCLPGTSDWSGAEIVAKGVCEGDSVRFTLHNNGFAPTAEALDYVIIDDMVIMRTGQLPAGFQPGADKQEVVFAQGEALRLNAQQEPGHPAAQAPSIGVENCNGVSDPSLLLEFRNEDGNPFTDLECREVSSAFDPNEKLAFPRGFSDAHYIEPNTPLSYQINFQNTGNDTAFTVVLRDTLSALLDPATLRMGPGSHNFTWQLEGPGVLTVTFPNIQLPDSTTNESASHGFVQFDIAQKKDNPIGAVVQNRAGIYFDINSVVLTNTVWHTIGVDFLETISGTSGAYSNTELLHIWPNPATESVFIPLDAPAQIRLLDPYGHTLRQYAGQAPGLTVLRQGLPDGLYLVEARMSNGSVQIGKLVLEGKK